MNDMEKLAAIIEEIHQIKRIMPALELENRTATKLYREACLPLKPARDRLKVAKAALKAARIRLDELCAPEGGT